MKVLILKLAGVALWSGAFLTLCRVMAVPFLYLTMLSGWGALCFLLSFELSGRCRRVRNGIEEKSPLQRAWMVAGIICIVSACMVLFLWL